MNSPIQLTVIGCGVLGRGIVEGLLSESTPSRSYRLALTGRRPEALDGLRKDYPSALVTGDNKDPLIWSLKDYMRSTHIVVIATKPHCTAEVCDEITQALRAAGATQQLVVVTVCPGITVSQLEKWLPRGTPIMRTMPNTPVAVKKGATAIFSNQHMTPHLAAEVQLIFECISPVVATLPREELMDIAASVSGSAPAYVYHLLQSLVAAGTAHGLPADIAHQLVVQSCMGAALLAQRSPDIPLQQLVNDVCVPGGSTEKAIRTLDRHDAGKIVQAAVEASWKANVAMSGNRGMTALVDAVKE
ncbi:pyrroline-5-carboxylate reductase dimerization-domain-containing protein [Ilyonectria sp. MPI-CAGE-AT-0026]|nr:pyrroline-5-carboxylate reductase dimerization-domain-containing protein [Ilyonectria sp. MPI-CAGE-AT-0026]